MKEKIEAFLFKLWVRLCKKGGMPRYKLLDLIDQQAANYHQDNAHKPEQFRQEVERGVRDEVMQVIDEVYGYEKVKA